MVVAVTRNPSHSPQPIIRNNPRIPGVGQQSFRGLVAYSTSHVSVQPTG
ncbi:uncharacterized protein METZ01_LOCUS12056 [marine metagenome]|uniref:Uncharacterized protein n=1 Tax=marine metagenome TaxID=408172 RepID=A0A381NX68_9ZZZZ